MSTSAADDSWPGGVLAVWSVVKRKVGPAVAQGVFAGLFLLWYAATDTVPSQVIAATPYVVTLLVLAAATQRLRMPAADGLRYRKGEAI